MSNIFKVAKILNSSRIVMNAGSDSKIDIGQKYLLYELSDEEIIDPDTNKSLGYLEIVKGTGIVTHVQKTMCTLESDTYRSSSKRITRNSPFWNGLNNTVEETESEKEKIPFEDPQIGDLLKRVN